MSLHGSRYSSNAIKTRHEHGMRYELPPYIVTINLLLKYEIVKNTTRIVCNINHSKKTLKNKDKAQNRHQQKIENPREFGGKKKRKNFFFVTTINL